MHSLCGVWFNSVDVLEAFLDCLFVLGAQRVLKHVDLSKQLLWAQCYAGCYREYESKEHLKLPFRIYGERLTKMNAGQNLSRTLRHF